MKEGNPAEAAARPGQDGDITVTDDRPLLEPGAPAPAAAEEEATRPITDFRAVLFLVVVLLLAGVLMYVINSSRF